MTLISLYPFGKGFTSGKKADRMEQKDGKKRAQMMKMHWRYKGKAEITYWRATFLVLFCCLLYFKGYIPFEKTGDNLFHLQINGLDVGAVADIETAERLFRKARKEVALKQDGMTYLDADLSWSGEEVLWGVVESERKVQQRMEEVLERTIITGLNKTYTLKVNESVINLAGEEEVEALLQKAVDKYDAEGKFRVALNYDADRTVSVLTADIQGQKQNGQEDAEQGKAFPIAGVQAVFAEAKELEETAENKAFEDFELGTLNMEFAQQVEIVESCLPASRLWSMEEAEKEIIEEEETPTYYKVIPGDTLSEISIKVNIPMDEIIAKNDNLENENSILHIGDELLITVPEPKLSVIRQEETYREESYNAEVQYIENDNWYTNQTVVRQQPSAGFRRAITLSTYLNDQETDKEVIKEEVLLEPIAKIVERGTKIPPSYIKPISGGRQSSGFGRRKQPTKGASTYHKGIDWAVPKGTAVYASCGGTVAKAGWGSGYGYVIYINHPDGRQTRYGHLSKVLVKAGQTVKQGEKIALSGNTGITSGPHLHFEILIGGKQVNPLKYLN